MPIKFQFKRVPIDQEGKPYDSLESFQAAQLAANLGITAEDAKSVVEQKALVLEILEITMESRPGARGKVRKRKTKYVADQFPLPLKEEPNAAA